METIFTRQNKPENIDRLAAQKQLYIEAKRMFLLLIILVVPGAILISLMKLIFGLFAIDISEYAYTYSISITLFELLIINFVINEKKKNAAKIQEEFDCNLYDLRWHKIVVGKKAPKEMINTYSDKFKSSGPDMNKLIDWYPVELNKKNHLEATLLCQKTNLNYDVSIRNSLKKRIWVFMVLTLLLIFIFALLSNATLSDFIIHFIVISFPVFTVSIKLLIELNKTIKNAEELKNIIESVIEDPENITETDIRSIQDKIFTSRKESSLIPEFYYNRVRNKLEAEMHRNASGY